MVKLLLKIFLLVLLIGCSEPSLPKLTAPATILAFGDSLTAGVGASTGKDYPSVLAQMSGLEVINAGVSGETTAEGLRRFESQLVESKPQLVILLEGGNDILRNHDLKQTEHNLSKMIAIAQRLDIAVLLVAVPQKNMFLTPAPLYQQLAEKYQIPLLEEVLSELLRQPGLKSDSIHLNDAGYQRLAETIYAELH
ncbi:GDSL-type esterase/lipase family protein [Shewanella gelidii]|uniref:Arylesterase n=1 Tax=Shewanella gelidii TaxID=1642821 RepID=A0A917N6L7_9GAMM|nr:GDSL-type esterase/lipase family protein [Shewanella gelidii]MCL1096910.1 GDSL-type esterase/lipase family protein [Shewanella gelidii]GGI71133.1 arylesterase [Shewanella gelidii]